MAKIVSLGEGASDDPTVGRLLGGLVVFGFVLMALKALSDDGPGMTPNRGGRPIRLSSTLRKRLAGKPKKRIGSVLFIEGGRDEGPKHRSLHKRVRGWLKQHRVRILADEGAPGSWYMATELTCAQERSVLLKLRRSFAADFKAKRLHTLKRENVYLWGGKKVTESVR